jgi:DNA-binding NtrC family response regulator
MRLGTHSGLELLARLRKRDPNALVIVTGALGTTQSVIESMRLGAFDFVRKEQLPFNLKIVVDAATKAAADMQRAQKFEPSLTIEQHQDSIVGQSPAMQEVFKMVGRISNSDAAVMITGESGSGKELVAHAIHQYSARHDRPFLAINCAAIPENLLESELFGHEKGSFTGASAQRIGRFEQADGGTLFLDEIGEISQSTQVKLLRFLETKAIERVGGSKPIELDVRLVAATNRNLEQLVRDGKFREDLFFRLNVVRLEMPPLRDRAEDVPVLLAHFIRVFSEENGVPPLTVEPGALRTLQAYAWPGNIRELRNFCENAVVLRRGGSLTEYDLEPKFRSATLALPAPGTSSASAPGAPTAAPSTGGSLSVEENEKRLLREALLKARGNRTKAAELMGVSRRTLHRKVAQWPELDVLDK